MVLVDEVYIFFGEEGEVDKLSVVGTQGQVLEPVPAVVFSGEDHILNSYAVVSCFIVTWFHGHDHAFFVVDRVVF